ncbi:malonate--CoA ligase [Roseateles saccharophilus]|uniref:Malonyl-CoA/methylmalonyl-CoA synthetase n=1 Tax=Roseateles saccharophilus TaxID=304 RepID=A0A4R3UIM9_ROSSA|nr:malonyl-CoA synthase [Roseateles saccharophilus]MDG0834908.1 malonyl-CoA synthase [Roseateles saccharophilus]TCU88911.1 malonyl-CoA/methylmalonyl-CoA synthetase [Roseateles saccharophilus]
MNLYTALRAGFPADLDSTAIDAEGALYSWRDLERGSAMLANWLDRLALPAGSRVAVHADKSVEGLVLYLAVLRAGHVYLPLNPAYHAAELEHFIADAAPAVVVCAGRNFGWVSKLAFQRGVRWVFTLNDDRSGTLLDRAAQMGDVHMPAERAAGDLAAILYTSGTTGRSKGAMLSHGNLLSNAETLKAYWDWKPDDVLLHALPIFDVHGLFIASHGALLNGSRMLWFNKFDAAAVARRLPEATVFMGVPTLYTRLLHEKQLDCRHMRLFISGSAPLLAETWHDWEARTGHRILERYGMSETLMLTSNPCRAEDGARMPGTVGRPLPGVGLRVVGDDGRACATGEIGGVQVRGPNVFGGYWQMPEKTAEEFTADGWFRTGDVGRLDEAGYLTLIGRSKDLIISGGFNVYPAEVEGFLNELPGVGESAVIGVPHEDFGEAVVAVITARGQPDPDALIAALKAHIAGFKVPKRILVVPELPRNAMGKVQKKLLREQHAAVFATPG